MDTNVQPSAAAAIEPPSAPPSLMAPLVQLPVYRFIWLALLSENICSWLMDVTNGWLMSSLSTSPLWVSLIQTATTLPVLVLALPAGAIADILKRRSILLFVEAGLAITNGLLAALTYLGWMTPELLLLLVFVTGLFLAIGMPAWQSLIPEVVTGPLLGPSLLLGGAAVNASRAVGPALAGVLISTGGPAASFAVNVLGFLFVWFALKRWSGPTSTPVDASLPAEQVLAAVGSGLRYAVHDANLQRVLLRFACVALAASAFWATLPLTARQGLGMGSIEYGLLMACFGAGAVLGAWLMNRDLASANLNVIIAVNSIAVAACMAAFAVLQIRILAYPLIFVVGTSWLALSGCFNVSLHSTVSAWVRARALSLLLIALQGSLALGGLVWGLVANKWGVPAALAGGAALMVLGLVATLRLTVTKGEMTRVEAYGLLPAISADVPTDRSPVAVQLDYRIDATDTDAFIAAMREVGIMRQRNGAANWNLLEDGAQPGRWVESFEAPTFLDHERQRERLTKADQALLEKVYAMHRGGGAAPVLTRWFGANKVSG